MTIDVIRLAKEAGIAPKPMILDGVEYEYQYVEFNDNIGGDEFGCIERFAALVAAAEREECAKVADECVISLRATEEHLVLVNETAGLVSQQIAAAVRARP